MQTLDEITTTMNQVLQCFPDLIGIIGVFLPKSDR